MLEFTDDALSAIAQQAIERDTGARGLRSILEQILRKSMYEIPSQPEVRRCIVNAAVVRGESPVIRETSLPYGAERFAPPEFGPERGTEGVSRVTAGTG